MPAFMLTGQVIAFDLGLAHDDDDLLRAFNALCPRYVQCNGWPALERAPPRFRRHQPHLPVFVYEAAIRQPMMARMSWWVKPQIHTRLDVDAMNWAAKLLGLITFASFGSPHGEKTDASGYTYYSEWQIESAKNSGTRCSHQVDPTFPLVRSVWQH